METHRREHSYRIRVEAAKAARRRNHPEHRSNPDEQRYASAHYAMSFTKGLEHDAQTGLVLDPHHFEAFREAINAGLIDPFTLNVPTPTTPPFTNDKRRGWEAPTAGLVYDLEGPDAQAVTMQPAPALGSDELAYEMAEVYELALLRDVPLTAFSGVTAAVTESVDRLNALAYSTTGYPSRPRKTNPNGNVTPGLAFRGSSPDVDVGPYLSQFLLIGTEDQAGHYHVADGRIAYGALTVDQRVPVAAKTDYMTDFDKWREVQDGWNTQNDPQLFDAAAPRRFITTPRDLATYVHYDALYEAYLNACLVLLAMKAPFDPAFDNLSGSDRPLFTPGAPYSRKAAGFALYGGPHILTLVTEVATRALKAVRYQKFNNHLRLRPEALAARIERAQQIEQRFSHLGTPFSDLGRAIGSTVGAIRDRSRTALLPMAFQEGSPMHPSYGAGHATVAGACVTVLKAYFDTSAVFATPNGAGEPVFKRFGSGDTAAVFTPNETGTQLDDVGNDTFLTVEGELNKLAANISIGRNMAGVHYFSDYYDSLRMGEEVAIGLLEEQALCYSAEPFILALPTFDGRLLRIGAR